MTKFGLMIEPISTECYKDEQCPVIQELKQNIPTAEVDFLPDGSISAVCAYKYHQFAQQRINEACQNCKKRQK